MDGCVEIDSSIIRFLDHLLVFVELAFNAIEKGKLRTPYWRASTF